MWSTVTGKVLNTVTASGEHYQGNENKNSKQKRQEENMFERLHDYKVYEAYAGDVSYKRDFTRYHNHTNSLIFKELSKEEEERVKLG
jgi:hypothetical protein